MFLPGHHRRIAFDSDPDALVASCQAEQEQLTARLKAARELLKKVKISNEQQVRGGLFGLAGLMAIGLRGDFLWLCKTFCKFCKYTHASFAHDRVAGGSGWEGRRMGVVCDG